MNKKRLLKLKLNLHEEQNPVDPVDVPEATDTEPNTVADDDKGFIDWMKKIFTGAAVDPVKEEVDVPSDKDVEIEEDDEKSELALKYKNRYKEKYANQISEANAAKDLADLKLKLATTKADGRPFDNKYLDFVASEIAKSEETPEEWLTKHPEYFEQTKPANPIVNTNMALKGADADYAKWLEEQRK